MRPEVSVVVPTYQPNRILLERVLQALRNQKAVPESSYEVLVVENPTKTVVGEKLTKHYGFRHEVCEKLGANAARNHGTELARGKLIGLLDDDVVPMPTWVSRVMGLHGFFPHVGIVGGKLSLEFLDEKPKWVNGAFLWWLSEVDWEADGFTDIYNKQQHIVSGNMTYRKSMWEEVGGFPEWAGLRGRDVLTVNDEISFTNNCGKLGNPHVGYDPDLVAEHLIPASRCTLDYMKTRAYGQGYADGRDWVRLEHKERCVPDIYHNHVQSPAENFLYFGEISSTRQRISHEESTREYIRHIIICRTEYFKGIVDAIEQDRQKIWQEMDLER